MNEEIEDLTKIESYIYKVTPNTYRVNSDCLSDSCAVFNKIKYSYFAESIPFQVCLQLFLKGRLGIDELCESLSVSKSYMYKVIKNLNRLLSKFDIRIAQDASKRLVLEGNEINIRLYAYNFFTTCVPNSIWLFPIQKEIVSEQVERIIHNRKLSDYSLNNLLILCGILHCRLFHGFILKDCEFKSLRSNFVLFQIDSFNCASFFSSYISDNFKIANEGLVFSFFVQILLNDIVSAKEICQVADRISAENSILHQFIVQFIGEYSSDLKIRLTKQQSQQIVYYYYLFFTFAISVTKLQLLDTWNLNTLDFEQLPNLKEPMQLLEPGNQIQRNIEKIYNRLINDSSYGEIRRLLLDDSIITYFTNLIFVQFSNLDTFQVSIYLHFIKNYITKKYLKEKLLLIYQDDMLRFVDDCEQADIIVTDNPEYISDSYHIILVNNIFDQTQFLHILNTINNEIMAILD